MCVCNEQCMYNSKKCSQIILAFGAILRILSKIDYNLL